MTRLHLRLSTAGHLENSIADENTIHNTGLPGHGVAGQCYQQGESEKIGKELKDSRASARLEVCKPVFS
jgi:hypothetical protein